MPVLVTRPAAEAGAWVEALRQRGIAAEALPLIAIGPPADPRPLQQARARLSDYAAVMFVSGNAVRGLLTPQPSWPAGTRAWAPGPGTAAALRAAGVPQAQIDQPGPDAAQFDSEALWQVVAPQLRAGGRVLLVRGADAGGQPRGREWLAQQLAAAGVAVDVVAAYARQLPQWTPAQQALAARSLADGSLWLFSSSEAISNLQQLLPQLDCSRARALATHPRIARAARDAGFGTVIESRPELAQVVASIEFPR